MISHENTKVVLIANWTFPLWGEEHNIPNIQENYKQLRKVLLQIDIPENNIKVFPDKESREIMREFAKIVNECRGKDSTLLVYYAGHGLPTGDGLLWATKDTEMLENDPNPESAIATSDIKKYLESRSQATRKILISDCCYAEDFLKNKLGSMQGYLDKNELPIQGTFYMFSSSSKQESLFPKDQIDQPTYFTQALLNAFNDGIDTNSPFCTVRNIFDKTLECIYKLKDETKIRDIPIPIKQEDKNVADYLLCKNPKYQDIERTDFDQFMIKEGPEKVAIFIHDNPTTPFRSIAVKFLKDNDAAEQELMDIENLPARARRSALLDVVEKNPHRRWIIEAAMEKFVALKQNKLSEVNDNNSVASESIRDPQSNNNPKEKRVGL